METIESLLNDLEGVVLSGKKAAFSNTDVVLNRRDVLSLISRIRSSFPQAMRDAEQIKKDRDEILNKAESYANESMDKAEEKARQLIAETEIVRQATKDAQAMRDEAEENYRKMDYEARALAFNILDSVEKVILDSSNVINDRKRKLIEE